MTARGKLGGRKGARAGASRPQSRAASKRANAHGDGQRLHDGERLRDGERLQKVLARAGLASRREAEEWIRAMRLTVNGQIATLGVRVGPKDQVRLDGRLIRQRDAPRGGAAFVCHRSPGENLQEPTALRGGVHGTRDATRDGMRDGVRGDVRDGADLADGAGPESPADFAAGNALVGRLPRRAGRRFIAVSPMPRIDGGLELVTGDGELAAKLQRSVKHLTSEFSMRIRGELSDEQIAGVLQGTLDSGQTVQVELCEPSGGEGTNRWYSLVARGASGKDVRQLFERQGALVSRVLRTKLGPIALERTLARGRFRELTEEELDAVVEAPSST